MAETIKIIDEQHVEFTLSNGKTYTMREPLAKDMEGLLQDLLQHKHTEQVRMLVGRITSPQLSKLEYLKLPIRDTQLINTVLNFFTAAPTAKGEMMEALQELGYLQKSESEPTTSPV